MMATASPMASFSSGRIPKYECCVSAASTAAHRRRASSVGCLPASSTAGRAL